MHFTEEQRRQMKENYIKNQMRRVDIKAKKTDNYSNEDKVNLPRHHTNCPSFEECPICYKCNHYDSTYQACRSCSLHKMDGVCHKKEIHNPRIYNMMISREKIDLDKE